MASLKLAILKLTYFIAFIYFNGISVNALNIGVQKTGQLNPECSRTCESAFCSVPPFLRYGKYCGILYGGCPGELPCDGLDACCMKHDSCIDDHGDDYLNEECNQNLLECAERFKKSGAQGFKGSICDVREVTKVVQLVAKAGVVAGGARNKQP